MGSLDTYIPDPALAEKYVPREIGIPGVLDIDLYEAAIKGGRKATLLSGPTGSGKTEGIRAVCAKNGWPLYIVQGSIDVTREAFCGGPVVNDDPNDLRQFVPNPGPLVKMVVGHDCAKGYSGTSQYEHTVFVLDEINVVKPAVLVWLNTINDDRRALTLPEERGTPNIRAHKGFAFFGTMNEGHEYTGTRELNPAVRNRFNTFPVGYSHQVEDTLLVDLPWMKSARDQLRVAMMAKSADGQNGIQSTISTRALLDFQANVKEWSQHFSEDQAVDLATEAFLQTCLEQDRVAVQEILRTARGGGSGYIRAV